MKIEDINTAKELADELTDVDSVREYLNQALKPEAPRPSITLECEGAVSLAVGRNPVLCSAIRDALLAERIRILGELEKLDVTL